MRHVVLSSVAVCIILLSLLFPALARAEDVPQVDDPSPGDLPMIVAVQVPAWEVHMGPGTNGNYGAMPVDSIDFSILTHYISFAAGLDTTGSAMRWNNIVTSRRKPLNDRIHAAGKPVLLCVGGVNSDGSLTKALSPANRATAINTILSAVRTYGYDGIDWDWEPFSVNDSANLFPVIRALHDSFQTMNAVWDPTKRPTQTADINPGNGTGQSNAWKRIEPYLDFIMIMAYDKIGSWTRMVYFDYAPYSRIDNVIVDRIPGGGQEMATAQRQALQLTGAGLPPEKIVLGMDFMAGMASGGDGTSTGGATWPRQTWVTAPSFRADYKFDDFYRQYLDTASAAIRHWDDTSKAYFLSIDKPGSPDDRFIGYAGGPGEDSTLFHHIELVKELGLGGMMVWDLSEAYLGTGKFPVSSYPDIERNWLTHQLRKHLLEVTPPPPPPPPPPDTIAPSVAFVTPADGDSLTGIVTVEASASDNVGVSRVQFLLDGAALANPDSSAPYAVLWNTDLHTDTIHILTALAYDTSGLEGGVNITVRLTSPPPPPPTPPPDTIAPSVAFVTPADGDSLIGIVTIEASASDNVGVSHVRFLLGAVTLGSPDSSAPYSVVWNTDLHPDGVYTLSAVAYDTTGLQESANIIVHLASPPPPPDTIAPSVAFVSPADGDSLIGAVTIEASASDNVGVSHVRFLLGGVALGSPDSSAPYTIPWNTDLHPDGVYALSAVAYDTTGLQGSANITVQLASPPPPPPPPPAAATVNIYGDQLVSPWINASWGAVNTFNSTERVFEGTYALKSVQNAWGAFSAHNGNWGSPVNLNTSLYDSLRFAVYPEATGLTLGVSFGNDIGGSFARVTKSNLPPSTWTVISIPMTALNAGGQVVHKLTIQNYTSAKRTYHLDDVELTVKPGGTAVSTTTPPGIEAESMLPTRYSLAQNYPNPFNPVTTIRYSLPADGHVRIAIYNMVGQEVAVPVDRDHMAGTWEVGFDAATLPSGVYTYRITAGAFTDAKKMVLIR